MAKVLHHTSPAVWACEGCKAFRPRMHGSHTFEPEDCKWASKGPARERKELLEPLEKAGQKIDESADPGG